MEGNDYEFLVAAENKAGIGPFSAPSKPITAKTPWEKPGKPGRPETSNVKGFTLDLQWKAPDSDGGGFQLNKCIKMLYYYQKKSRI